MHAAARPRLPGPALPRPCCRWARPALATNVIERAGLGVPSPGRLGPRHATPRLRTKAHLASTMHGLMCIRTTLRPDTQTRPHMHTAPACIQGDACCSGSLPTHTASSAASLCLCACVRTRTRRGSKPPGKRLMQPCAPAPECVCGVHSDSPPPPFPCVTLPRGVTRRTCEGRPSKVRAVTPP